MVRANAVGFEDGVAVGETRGGKGADIGGGLRKTGVGGPSFCTWERAC